MKKFFAFMVILCMVFTVAVYAMEPTGPPGMLLDNVVFGISQPVQAAGVAENPSILFPYREQVAYIGDYQACWAIPAMLAGLICGATFQYTLMDHRQVRLPKTVAPISFQLFA